MGGEVICDFFFFSLSGVCSIEDSYLFFVVQLFCDVFQGEFCVFFMYIYFICIIWIEEGVFVVSISYFVVVFFEVEYFGVDVDLVEILGKFF